MNDDPIAPRPWIVDEIPNGAYLRGADGKRFAILMGVEANRVATARFIAEMANRSWLRVVQNSPATVSDGGDGQQSQIENGD